MDQQPICPECGRTNTRRVTPTSYIAVCLDCGNDWITSELPKALRKS